MKIPSHFTVAMLLLKVLTAVGLLLLMLDVGQAKIYDRCELARELYEVHDVPEEQLATWVCLARHESEFDTSARNHGSGDHGIFQISELFWCSPSGFACGVSCEDLRNDDIEDDVICARRIFREHKRLSGDGFNAWVVYNQHCKDQHYVDAFLDGCFDGRDIKTTTERPVTAKPTSRITATTSRKISSTTSRRITTTTTTTTTTSKPFVYKQTNRFDFTTKKPIQKTSSKGPQVREIKSNVGKHEYTISKTGFKLLKT